MAIPADTVWEVRTTGSDSLCSGGFSAANKGATGVDYTVQNSAQYTYTANLSGAGGTTLTGVGFTNDIPGNVINITGQGFYCITGFTNSTTVTVDRALGTFSGATGYVGGGLATLSQAVTNHVSQNKIYVLNTGTPYTITVQQNIVGGAASAYTEVIGYTTNRNPYNTDAKPEIDTANNITVFQVGSNTNYARIYNVYIKQTGTVRTGIAVNLYYPYGIVENCRMDLFNLAVQTQDNHMQIIGNYANQCTALINAGNSSVTILGNTAYKCTGTTAIGNSSTGIMSWNLVVASSGNTGAGISIGPDSLCAYNTVTGFSGGSGKAYTYASGAMNVLMWNNLAANCVTGFALSSNTSPDVRLYGCAAYNCTTDYDAAFTGETNRGFVHLTADPFTNAASDDYTLNATAGGGASLRGLGWPAALPGLSPTNYPTPGVYQPNPVAAAGPSYFAR